MKHTDLEIRRGEFLAILGPSGCGKTTLLRLIGGFIRPSSGTIEVDGRDVTRFGPEKRPTNMVFQGYGLFPHMNLWQNIAYGLRLKKLPKTTVDQRVSEAVELVRLRELASRAVSELSGGQQQRVALARALVMQPKVLLLDEPLAALDLKLRQTMQEELRRIHREIGGTFVFVTHDQGEALALATRIAVMNTGRIEQIGAPEDIYSAPASRFVASFIGEANLLEGARRGGEVILLVGARFPHPGPDGPVHVIVRPEAIRFVRRLEECNVRVEGRVEEVLFLGTHVKYVLALATGERLVVHDGAEQLRVSAGATVIIGWPLAAQRVFAQSDERIATLAAPPGR